MKVSSFAVARPNYYDRNAAGTSVRYIASGVAPHAQTIRWTVTISSGQKAFAEMVGVRIAPTTVATVFGAAEAGVDTISGGVNSTIIYIQQKMSAALTVLYAAYPLSVTLYAGDQLVGFTSDGSTGGTALYIVDSKYTTFSA
jgi:hypothetical protein